MKNVLYNLKTHDIDTISLNNVRILRNGFFVDSVTLEIKI